MFLGVFMCLFVCVCLFVFALNFESSLYHTVNGYHVFMFRYNIMLECWDKEPSKRPSFQQIIRQLDEIREEQTVSFILLLLSNSINSRYF